MNASLRRSSHILFSTRWLRKPSFMHPLWGCCCWPQLARCASKRLPHNSKRRLTRPNLCAILAPPTKHGKSMSPCCLRCARKLLARNWLIRLTTSATLQPCPANIHARWSFPARALPPGDAGVALSNAGNYSEAAAELDLGLKLTAETGNAQTAVLLLNDLGIVDYYQAKYSEALRTYESALQYVEKSSAEPWSATWRQFTLLNLATLYQRLGNDQRAIKTYNDILAHPEAITPRDLGHLNANMGAIYRHLGDAKQALQFYGYADEYYAKEKDIDGELGVLKNSGIVLALDMGRLQDALKTFDRVRTLAAQTNNQREAMQALLYRGETLYRMDKLPEAEKEFNAALAEADKLGTVEEQWKAVNALGKIALKNGERETAEVRFRNAIQRIESLRSQLQLSRLKADFLADKRDVYDALIKLLLERNDAAAAFEFMERSRARVFQDRFFGDKLSPDALTLHSIQARLDPHTALIEFWAGAEGVAAVWVTREKAGISQSHFSAAEMDALQRFVTGLPDNLTA